MISNRHPTAISLSVRLPLQRIPSTGYEIRDERVYWTIPANTNGAFEFHFSAAQDPSQSIVISAGIVSSPNLSLSLDSIGSYDDQQPQILLDGVNGYGDVSVNLYADSSCTQLIGSRDIDVVREDHLLVETFPLSDGIHDLFTEVTVGDITFPCTSEPIKHRYDEFEPTVKVVATQSAFAALKTDGSVVTWGHALAGADSSSVSAQLSSGVQKVVVGEGAVAALKTDGSVITWGSNSSGGDSSGVAASLSSNVTDVFTMGLGFLATKNDGSVVHWGSGDFSTFIPQMAPGVQEVIDKGRNTAFLKIDGSVVTRGGSGGGDSSAVSAQLTSGGRSGGTDVINLNTEPAIDDKQMVLMKYHFSVVPSSKSTKRTQIGTDFIHASIDDAR